MSEPKQTAKRVALAVLASGRSQRFGAEDKLIASLGGRPLAAFAADQLSGVELAGKFAIVGRGSKDVAALFAASNWSIIDNAHPERGQGRSVALAAAAARATSCDALLITLADMPLVTNAHLNAIISAGLDCDGVMTQSEGRLLPPALFARTAFDTLCDLDGDRGARWLFDTLPNTARVEASAELVLDVDTPRDLDFLNRALGRNID